MKKKDAEKWVDALRSGKYKQGRERGSCVKGESFEYYVRLGDLQRCREDASGLTMFLNKCSVWSEKVIVTFPKQKTKVQKLLAELSSEEIDELKGLM